MVEKKNQNNNILWPEKGIWSSNVRVHIQSYISTQPCSFISILPMVAFHYHSSAVSLRQRPYSPQSLEYLLPGPLLEVSRPLISIRRFERLPGVNPNGFRSQACNKNGWDVRCIRSWVVVESMANWRVLFPLKGIQIQHFIKHVPAMQCVCRGPWITWSPLKSSTSLTQRRVCIQPSIGYLLAS